MKLNTQTLKKAYTFLSKDKRLKFLIDKFSNEIDIKERYNESYPMAIAFLIIDKQVSFRAAITIKKRFINKVSDLSNDEIINLSDEELSKEVTYIEGVRNQKYYYEYCGTNLFVKKTNDNKLLILINNSLQTPSNWYDNKENLIELKGKPLNDLLELLS